MKNPYYRAILALGYINLIASILFYGQRIAKPVDTIFAPIAMLSLLTLSVAVMGYLFFFEPLQLYLSGQKAEATTSFLKTIATFALTTIVVFAIMLLS
ncbi:MAG: hypothetical protein NT077_03260 [Candidatus Taylorbacteria bacterium]|nr:hypothetical protein [Candidatus Taylorbacteria bacterium]